MSEPTLHAESPPATVEELAALEAQVAAGEATIGELTMALVEANDQLLAVYDLASVRLRSLDEDEAVAEILRLASRQLQCDVALLDGSERTHRNGEPTHDDDWMIECGRSMLADQSRSQFDNGRGRNVLAVPVQCPSDGERALIVGRKTGRFNTSDRRVVEAVADTLAGVVTTTALHERALVASEHDTAARLAQGALPRRQPAIAGVDAHAMSSPARAAGGDFYAHAVVDGALHFVVGDVSGKGLPAAIMMATLVSASNAAIRRLAADGPSAILAGIDSDAYDFLSDAGMFATMMVGTVWPEQGVFEFANAGHGPLMIVDELTTTMVGASVPPVGVLPLGEIATTTCLVAENDLVVIGSDGLTEQVDPAGSMLGDAGLADVVASCLGQRSADVAAGVFSAVEDFASGEEQADDRTIMVLQLNGELAS